MYFVNRYSLTPMITLLVTTRHGVIDDFYFFGHRWSHYFILLSATTLCKMTGYDLQLHLKYRNNIWNKKNKNTILFMHKNVFTFTPSSETQGQSVESGEKAGRKFSGTGKRAPGYRLSPNLCPKIQADAGSWLGTKNALYCAQSAKSFSWVLFVSSYTTATVRFVHQACACKGNFYFLLS